MKRSDRMKSFEKASEQVLPLGLPVVVRLDGNSFSNLTKYNFEKPFDPKFDELMNQAAIAVMEYSASIKFAYVQSDEISIVLTNTPEQSAFLGNRTQKMCSLLASKASAAFSLSIGKPVAFDCRAFIIPSEEVFSYFQWRQNDTFKNFVSSYAYWGLVNKYGRKTAQKMLDGQHTANRLALISKELEVNPFELPNEWMRGRCIWRDTKEVPVSQVIPPAKLQELIEKGEDPGSTVPRLDWRIDTEVPDFRYNTHYFDTEGKKAQTDPTPV